MIPTPTQLPPGQERFSLESFTLWNSTDTAIQTWRWHTNGIAEFVQVLIIIVIVVAAIYTINKFRQQMMNKDSED
jgi:flagellar biogenesis protein FliO